jgi:hypothetical protein
MPVTNYYPNDATDHRLVMLAVDMPVGENVASGRQPTRDDFRRIDEERRQA